MCLINSTITNKSKSKLHCEFDLEGNIITIQMVLPVLSTNTSSIWRKNNPIKSSPSTSIVD